MFVAFGPSAALVRISSDCGRRGCCCCCCSGIDEQVTDDVCDDNDEANTSIGDCDDVDDDNAWC